MPPRPPNILLICSDQHTPRILGCSGDRVVRTPNLDALAAAGARFDSCYCNSPLCVPSRMSLMTGRFPWRCESIGNQSVLDSRYPTLAHIAVRGGYHPVLCGKMHFQGHDQRHGFLERPMGDFSGGALLGGMPHGPGGIPHLGNCSRPDTMFHTGPGENPMVGFDDAVTEHTLAWIRAYARHPVAPPFFLVAGFLLPHNPFIAPRPVYDRYRDSVRAPKPSPDELTTFHPNHRDYRRFIDLDSVPEANCDRAAVAYYAMTDLLDRNIGKLLDGLRESGLWNDTIVIYTSDHGEMLGQHGLWHKECFYEDSARVPLIIRHPHRNPGQTVDQPRSLVDLMPTLCDWLGVSPPPGLDGTSLDPALRGEEGDAPPVRVETYTHWTQAEHGVSANRMVRDGDWKLCYYGAYDSCELFDLRSDPHEQRNRIDDPSLTPLIARLKALLFSDGWSRDVVRDQDARLEAFGHLTNVRHYRNRLRHLCVDEATPLRVDLQDAWPGVPHLQSRLDADPDG